MTTERQYPYTFDECDAEITALRTALREFHAFVLDELDSDGGNVEDYMLDPAAIEAAKRAGCVRLERCPGCEEYVHPDDDDRADETHEDGSLINRWHSGCFDDGLAEAVQS